MIGWRSGMLREVRGRSAVDSDATIDRHPEPEKLFGIIDWTYQLALQLVILSLSKDDWYYKSP